MATPDLSGWPTKDEAAETLRVSPKTVEQFAKEGRIEKRVWRRDGRGPLRAVYNPDDVAQLAAERHPEAPPFVLPAHGNGNGHRAVGIARQAPVEVGSPLAEWSAAFAAALRTIAGATAETSETSEKCRPTYVRLPEASALTGLSETFLRRMITRGTLTAIKDRGWKVRRKDLEAL